MSFIGPTVRSFELHYATNVLSYLWLGFFPLGIFFFWQPVVQTFKLLTVLIEFSCHYYGRGIWETAFLQWGVWFESQGKIQLLWKKPWRLSRCPTYQCYPSICGCLLWDGGLSSCCPSVMVAAKPPEQLELLASFHPPRWRGCLGTAEEILAPR